MIRHLFSRVVCLFVFILISLTMVGAKIQKESRGDRKAKKIESRADRKFVRQDFDEAMTIYETAFKQALTSEYGAGLHLKVARLYLSLLDYPAAVPHYESAMTLSDKLFTPTDVCNYLDALRFSGRKMKAIDLARRYAYRDAYHTDQRYQNILHALTYEEGFLPVGTSEFTVKPLDKINTSNSEFWVGVKGGDYFYASSNSRFHDPNKKFYHRSRYYSLQEDTGLPIRNERNKSNKKHLLDMIPQSLQNGPVSFSENMTRMVVTQVYYGKKDRIGMGEQGLNAFQTRLYYSDFNAKKKGWSSFKEAFPQKAGYSYSHPCLFDGDRSLLFASDMPGGFGGYDIYVAHWDDKKRGWGEPRNLGAAVNTEGDEISPLFFKGNLIFSSNGHVGFGGYDIYSISYEEGQVVAGSLVHFDYPVNTLHNDFSLLPVDESHGYIVSDRKISGKDDIFYFEPNAQRGGKGNSLFGMTESSAISSGAINLVQEEGTASRPSFEAITRPRHFMDYVVNLYFDFDSYLLKPEAFTVLNRWKQDVDPAKIDTLVIEGYADDIGSEQYNLNLSVKRAAEVGKWIESQGIAVPQIVLGRGQTSVNVDLSAPLPRYDSMSIERRASFWTLPLKDRIELNREARRVEIKAILK